MCFPAAHLFEGVQHFLPLAEVPEEQLQRSGHQGGVVVHRQMDQNPQEHPASFVVHFQDAVHLPAQTQLLSTRSLQEAAGQHGRPHIPDSKHGLRLVADLLQVDGG